MKRRLLSFVLCLAMLVGLIPTLAFADAPGAKAAISFVEVNIPAPKEGAVISEVATCGEGYSSFTVMWTEDGRLMKRGDKFAAGHEYSVEIWLKARDSFAVDGNFDPLVTGTLNGQEAKITRAYEQAAYEIIAMHYDFGREKQPIAYIALEINEPVAGKEANFSVTDKSSGAIGAVGYDFYGPNPVRWYDKTAGRYLSDGDKFAVGHVYRIDVYVCAMDGYAFPLYEGQPSVLANLNWNDTKVMAVYGYDPTELIALSCEFPALEGHEHVFNLKYDADTHWQECRDCGYIQGEEKHKADMENVCTECGYKLSGAPDHDDSYVFPFTDVAENAWFYPWIKGAHQMGLINGKTAATYCPKDNMTYAEAIKLAACMHQLYHEGKVTLENGKPDWRTSYYDYCRDKGIIRAYANAMEPGYAELFAVASQPINRQTYVYIFSRALPAEAFKEINNIPDNSIPDVAVNQGVWDDGIYLFYRAGILNGTDAKGTFKPEGNIQRSEVAAILNRMMDESVRVGAPAELGK